MPFTGGASPSPERYGGPDAPGNEPRLQRIYESLCAQHGSAYAQDWPPSTPFGIEMMAYARAICFDVYGASERMANQFIPSKMTVNGLLPRWERIFNVPPLPGDTEPVRRARVAAAFGRLGQPNSHQPVVDALSVLLAPIYTGMRFTGPNTALQYWPGYPGGPTPPGGTATSTLPWYSFVDYIQIQVNWRQAPFYSPASNAPNNTANSPNALYWALIGSAGPILDAMCHRGLPGRSSPRARTATVVFISTKRTSTFLRSARSHSMDRFWELWTRQMAQTVIPNLQMQAHGLNRNYAGRDAEGIKRARELLAEASALVDKIEAERRGEPKVAGEG
jgi:hypothetical protein